MTLLEEFKQHLFSSGLSSGTIRSYSTDVRQFLEYLRSLGVTDPADLERSHVTAFRSRLIADGYSVASVNKKVNSLHSFNHFLAVRGVLIHAVVRLGKDRLMTALGTGKEVEVFTE